MNRANIVHVIWAQYVHRIWEQYSSKGSQTLFAGKYHLLREH